jgi:spore maturation protein CgeB
MKFVLFVHSLASCWNHGNAHFLRGIASELLARGHRVEIFEPADGWSAANLAQEHGRAALREYQGAYPGLRSHMYLTESLDLDDVLYRADVVIVHEWNDPELVRRIGEHRSERGDYRLLFHDTHHRAATAPEEMGRYDLSNYDGVLAFGEVIRDLYLRNEWARQAWTWHEAADHRVFRPLNAPKEGDLVWIGNWGDEERTAELHEFLLEPVKTLGLRAKVYGVRYPDHAIDALRRAGIKYGGWLPNHRVPEVFARYGVTVHVPRRPYVEALPGIPTIRPFEALACGIPLVSAPWVDAEGLFRPDDFPRVSNGKEMTEALRETLHNPKAAQERADRGRETVLRRHTCTNRVDELSQILDRAGGCSTLRPLASP